MNYKLFLKNGSKVANNKKPERTVSYKTIPSKIYFKLRIRSLHESFKLSTKAIEFFWYEFSQIPL